MVRIGITTNKVRIFTFVNFSFILFKFLNIDIEYETKNQEQDFYISYFLFNVSYFFISTFFLLANSIPSEKWLNPCLASSGGQMFLLYPSFYKHFALLKLKQQQIKSKAFPLSGTERRLAF